MDRISVLPDEIICHILSFLNTKKAASTSVLAKRWRTLFASTINLDLDYLRPENRSLTAMSDASFTTTVQAISSSFVDFVDSVLSLREGLPLKRFSLETKCDNRSLPWHISQWIRRALAADVSQISVAVDYSSWAEPVFEDGELVQGMLAWAFVLPKEIFSSKTLVMLRVKSVFDAAIISADNFDLPALKTLYLLSVRFRHNESGLEKLLAGCKVLEELQLEHLPIHMWKHFSVASTSLKRLTVTSRQNIRSPSAVSFDTPNLLFLEYSDLLALKYPKVRLDSLLEARIDIRLTARQAYLARNNMDPELGDPKKLIFGIQNVRKLYLCSSTLEVMKFCCDEIPTFSKVSHLTIDSAVVKYVPESGWESLPLLLKSCPQLHTLIFKGFRHRCCGDTCLCKSDKEEVLSCSPVKVLKIFLDEESSIEIVMHMLKTMRDIVSMEIHYGRSLQKEDMEKQLELITKASPICSVQLISNRDLL